MHTIKNFNLCTRVRMVLIRLAKYFIQDCSIPYCLIHIFFSFINLSTSDSLACCYNYYIFNYLIFVNNQLNNIDSIF